MIGTFLIVFICSYIFCLAVVISVFTCDWSYLAGLNRTMTYVSIRVHMKLMFLLGWWLMLATVLANGANESITRSAPSASIVVVISSYYDAYGYYR